MILINILLVLLIFLILSDLCIKNSPKSKLNLVPINYKIKKKEGLNELIIDLKITNKSKTCLLYTSPSPRDSTLSRMPSSA